MSKSAAVSKSAKNSAVARADSNNTCAEELIRNHLQLELSKRSGSPVQIADMRWEAIARQTSFSARILTVQLNHGEALKLFVKDYSYSSLPKDGLEQRSQREYRLYRDLLSQAALETPQYFGVVATPEKNGFYLVIEHVEGIWLDYCGFEDWTRAAAWLGKLHGTFMNRHTELANADYLVTHDRQFFMEKAAGALQSVKQYSTDLAQQLARALEGYDELVSIMTAQPRTLVHGSFRLRNVLVNHTDNTVRICPVDWELAANGAGLYDLAFLADGFEPDKVDILLDAYLGELSQQAEVRAGPQELSHIIHCFRLHKILKSLSDSVSLSFAASDVNEYVDMALKVRRTLDAGYSGS